MRRRLTKREREYVRDSHGGRCAYCGVRLGARWHVDHVESLRRAGLDHVDNLMPACAPCNSLKATLTVEEFRSRIAHQVERLRKLSPRRHAERYGLVGGTGKAVVFFFEAARRES